MKTHKVALIGAALAAVCATALTVAPVLAKPATAASPNSAKIGQAAPDFTLIDADGKTHTLSEVTKSGKIVVLQWFNPECPVVKGFYSDGRSTFNDLYAKYEPKNVQFLAINSGGPGNQGFGKDAEYAKKWDIKYPILIDDTGDVGKAYGAKTTPHMFIIDTKGDLRYMGAIDNSNTTKPDSDGYVNYVSQALDQVIAGETVSTPETRSFGCNVKYKK